MSLHILAPIHLHTLSNLPCCLALFPLPAPPCRLYVALVSGHLLLIQP